LPGVLLVADQWRSYPALTLAAQTIGFVGYKGDTKVGVYGLERFGRYTLQTKSGLYVNPFAEIFSNVTDLVSSAPSQQGGDVITSIEQCAGRSEKTLDDVMKEYTPRLSGGIVMDPRTGPNRRNGSRPTFDPNHTTRHGSSASFRTTHRRQVRTRIDYETSHMAAGIDSGAVTLQTTYTIRDAQSGAARRSATSTKARGVLPMQEDP